MLDTRRAFGAFLGPLSDRIRGELPIGVRPSSVVDRAPPPLPRAFHGQQSSNSVVFHGYQRLISSLFLARLFFFLFHPRFFNGLHDSVEYMGGRRVGFRDRRTSRFFDFATLGKADPEQPRLMRSGNFGNLTKVDIS